MRGAPRKLEFKLFNRPWHPLAAFEGAIGEDAVDGRAVEDLARLGVEDLPPIPAVAADEMGASAP
jgi:hypothetical protein